VRNLGVGDRYLVCKPFGKSAQSGAEDDGYFWLEGGALADEGGGAFGLNKCRF
jgi:hypothetical protein